MLDWGVEPDDVIGVAEHGEVIEEYEDGGRLILGRSGVRPLHVVVGHAE